MDVDAQMAESKQIPKAGADGLNNLTKGSSDEYAESVFNSEWEYDFLNNKGESVKVQKAQYAYYKWNEELKENGLQVGLKKADISELWTGVYQIIGFYSVFQGVIYQGVTAMSAVLSCTFYKLPVTLSVLASAATILGIYMKLSKLSEKTGNLHKETTQGETLQRQIEACHDIDVKEFSIGKVEKILSDGAMSEKIAANDFEKMLNNAWYLKWAVLAFLTVYSTMFSYLDYIVMCRGYY